jgi:enamine deaminase RidA (YjgF/YER057c/UK114 family)
MVEIRAKHFPKDPPASTFLVVASLAGPAFLVEVDAIAVLD